MRTIIVTGYKPPAPTDTIVVFRGIDEELGEIHFGVDHRMAVPLAQAVNEHVDGEGEGDIPCAHVEDWQVMA